ncbi:hypothetical protein ACYCSE_23270 [Paenibacillus sp. SEL1]|uniref:hypothetical protein n=1 Tax=Paenibacillus sp. Lou8.1 TaxID=2962041 RepID=UPI0020B8AD5F|nr:hypothetical protein [Paenibacillus sp. Lou8.1]MCP3806285.1 hypothetical protein [Paenibacillus sp. Lou8.1]
MDIAQAVLNKQGLNSELIQRINCVFAENQFVRLKVSWISEDQHLHTEFIDEPEQLKRMYMESLISLLKAMGGSN